MKDAVTKQPNKIKVLNATKPGNPSVYDVVQVLVHTLQMVGTPFTTSIDPEDGNLPWKSRLFRFLSSHYNFDNAGENLKSPRDLYTSPPRVLHQQICMLCVGDDLLFTISPDTPVTLDDHSEEEEDEEAMYGVLSYARKLIEEKRPDVMTYGMKYIVTVLVQEVTEINFAVRDVLTSWLNHVEDSIESEAVHKVSARDSAHLRVFAEMLAQYKVLMKTMTT